jgi:monoterpene epsilon-lactone hydrolase
LVVVVLACSPACTFVSNESDGFPSVQMQAAKSAARPYRLTTARTENELEDEFGDRDYPELPNTPDALSRVARVTERTFGEFKVLDVVPKRDPASLRILYLHGGGYIYELHGLQLLMLATLVEQTGASITVPAYPLAPEFTHEDAFPFVEEVYRELLEDGPASNVVMGGDSAGAGLVLSQLLHYRSVGLDMPSKLFLISPWLDVTMSHPDVPALAGTDCILDTKALRVFGQWWADDQDPSLPAFSPIFGDWRDLPPTILIGGTSELFLPDIRDFADTIGAELLQVRAPNAQALGNSRHVYFEYPGALHDFPVLGVLPEGQDSLNRIAAFLKE